MAYNPPTSPGVVAAQNSRLKTKQRKQRVAAVDIPKVGPVAPSGRRIPTSPESAIQNQARLFEENRRKEMLKRMNPKLVAAGYYD